MADYALSFARSARKELEALDGSASRRVLTRIENLQDQPRPSGCLKLQGSDALWCLRVGDYRVIYSIVDASRTVDIIAVRHRSDAYR